MGLPPLTPVNPFEKGLTENFCFSLRSFFNSESEIFKSLSSFSACVAYTFFSRLEKLGQV